MVNLSINNPLGANVVYLDTTSSYSTNPSGSFFLQFVQDYDLTTSGSLDITLINKPNRNNPMFVFRTDFTGFPSASGQYTITVQEALRQDLKWSEANYQFGSIHRKWSEGFITSSKDLATERAFFVGGDNPSYDRYLSPNETAAYTVYDG